MLDFYTSTQVHILKQLRDEGKARTGRGGVSTSSMKALARMALVRPVKVSTWETTWQLTEDGRAAAEGLK